MEQKVVFFLEQFWSFLAVSIAVALGGIAAKQTVAIIVPAERQIAMAEGRRKSNAADIATDPNLPLWYRLWRATISTHPMIVGGLIGLAPLPTATWVPDSTVAHVLWFGMSGALSGQMLEIMGRLMEIVPALFRQRLGVKSEPRPPPPPDDAPPDGSDK